MYTRSNCPGKSNRPPVAAINLHAWAKGARRRAPACRPVPSRAWPVRPLRLPGTTWRTREARGIAPRFGGLLGPRHGRDAMIWFPRKPAHSGCCRTRRSQIPPCSRGKLRRPTHPKMADLHSFGDYCRGDEPRAGNGTRILFKNIGAGIAPQSGSHLGGFRYLVETATRPGPLGHVGRTRQTKTSPTSQLPFGVFPNPAMGQLPSHPGRTMGRDLNHR